jgi:hypothetical protein
MVDVAAGGPSGGGTERSAGRGGGRAALLAALVLASGGLGACGVKAQPVRAVGLNRNTPRATYEYMVAMVGAMQVEAEWQALSPGFKRRLSESAGRNVDFGDYSHARATIAGNDKKELRLFLESEYVGEEFVSEKEAIVTIRSGSRQLRPRLVRLSTWELVLQGENQPVSGFIPRIGDVVGITPEGDVQVRVTPESNTASFLKDIPADRIESVTMKSEWFLEDFGGIEHVMQEGISGRAEGVPPPTAPPSYAPEVVRPAPTPGSPDALPPPPHPGSPDAGGPVYPPPPLPPSPSGSPDG